MPTAVTEAQPASDRVREFFLCCNKRAIHTCLGKIKFNSVISATCVLKDGAGMGGHLVFNKNDEQRLLAASQMQAKDHAMLCLACCIRPQHVESQYCCDACNHSYGQGHSAACIQRNYKVVHTQLRDAQRKCRRVEEALRESQSKCEVLQEANNHLRSEKLVQLLQPFVHGMSEDQLTTLHEDMSRADTCVLKALKSCIEEALAKARLQLREREADANGSDGGTASKRRCP